MDNKMDCDISSFHHVPTKKRQIYSTYLIRNLSQIYKYTIIYVLFYIRNFSNFPITLTLTQQTPDSSNYYSLQLSSDLFGLTEFWDFNNPLNSSPIQSLLSKILYPFILSQVKIFTEALIFLMPPT